MESTKTGNPTVAITLPVALTASLAILLLLIVKNASYEELALSNEREAARRQELAVQVGPLKEQVEAARGELAGLRTELKLLEEQRKAAREAIDQSNALAKSLQQLKADVAALDKEGQDKRRGLGDAGEKVAALNKQVTAAEEHLRERRTELAGLTAQLGTLTVREKSVAQSLAEKERALAAKSNELDAKTEEARRMAQRVAEGKAEADSQEARLKRYSSERVALDEVERLRAERWELQARLGVLKDDRLAAAATIKGLEETKQRLEKEVDLLAQRRAAAEAAAAQTKKN
jgi:chromosome segregation ATPase